ncbi:MAG: MBL fold metallo-hydrolase [Planctomycetota bacterium]
MNPVARQGLALIEEIDGRRVEPGELCFWWLGQQGYVVKTARRILYFDPFLSPHPRRRVPPLLRPEEVTNADFVFGTHDHRDHIDRPALPLLLAASPGARLVVPRLPAETLPENGIRPDRIRALDDEGVLEEAGVKVTAIRSAHEFFDYTPAHGYPYLQYVVEADGVAIHHAGDGLLYDGLASRLRAWRLTVSFLPVNGRDGERYARKIRGNLTFQEAVDLAGAVRPRLVVPGHYEMFVDNGEDPQRFAAYFGAKYPDLAYWIGPHGAAVSVRAD